MASFYTWFLEEQGLEGAKAIGFSMGGWIAAEVAASCRHAFSKLMLVDAVGIKPQQGEIADIFIISPARSPSCCSTTPSSPRIRPDLRADAHSRAGGDSRRQPRDGRAPVLEALHVRPRLPGLLGRVNIPTRIVWGREDRLVPLECGELYRQAIPESDLVIIDNCGHSPQVEKPDEFVKAALDFLA